MRSDFSLNCVCVAVGAACILEKDSTKSRGFTKTKTKQNKRTAWHLETKRPEDTSSRHLWLVKYYSYGKLFSLPTVKTYAPASIGPDSW